MGLFSAISSAISAVGSFISSVASSIGPAISSFAKNVVDIIAKLPIPESNLLNLLSIAAKVIHSVAEYLKIKSEEDPEILGAKAAQCDKKVEDFDDSIEEYIAYLKDNVELDKEKFDRMTSEEKLGCKAVGMALETKAIEEKIGEIDISPECLSALIKIRISGINIDTAELVEVFTALKQEGITDFNDVVECLEGKGKSDRLKTGEALASALGEGADEKISELKEAVREYQEESK